MSVIIILSSDGGERIRLPDGSMPYELQLELEEVPWPRIPIEGERLLLGGEDFDVTDVFFDLQGNISLTCNIDGANRPTVIERLVEDGFKPA